MDNTDVYKNLASVMFDRHIDDITSEQRNHAKTLVWSWAYTLRTPQIVLEAQYQDELNKLNLLKQNRSTT